MKLKLADLLLSDEEMVAAFKAGDGGNTVVRASATKTAWAIVDAAYQDMPTYSGILLSELKAAITRELGPRE